MALLPVITLRTSRTNSCLRIVNKTLAWIRRQIWQRFLPQTVDRVSAAVHLEAHYTVVHRLCGLNCVLELKKIMTAT
jgi:hypothetical protein